MRIIILLLCLLFTQGCMAAMLAAIAIDNKEIKNRQEFTAKMQTTNVERASRGLPPLDWCVEVYRVDRAWAQEDPECRKRIRAYKRGNVMAMDSGTKAETLPFDDVRPPTRGQTWHSR